MNDDIDAKGLVKVADQPTRLPVKAARPMVPARRTQPGLPKAMTAFEMYIAEINRVPLLTRDEEVCLAEEFQKTRDVRIAKKLVESNLRFVVKIAYSYKHYNVKLIDLIQEGNIGLMRAVEKFNPDRGYRLISYAVWWIKAYMQNFIIKSWSLVKVGTTQMQRQLFFRYQADKDGFEQKSVEETLDEEGGGGETAVLISADVRRQKAERELMAASRDFSLDALIDGTDSLTYMDMLADGKPQQEDKLARSQIMRAVSERLNTFSADLNDKEQYILQHRLLTDEPETLQEIGEKFKVSRERIRQIENSLKERLRKSLDGIEGVEDMVD